MSMARRRRLLLAVCLAAFMATLDTSIVNVALPQIARQFNTTLAQISWVITGYLLANVSLLLVSGRLADMLAPGRLFLAGMVIFAGASAGCGLSPELIWMVGMRLVQGVGGSLMLGTAPKIIVTLYQPGERGLPLGLFSTAFASGISVGAPLGGFITAHWGWPYIFLINVPICVGAVLTGRPLRRLRPETLWNRRAFDLAGSVILAGGLILLMAVLNRVRGAGGLDGVIAAGAVGVVVAMGVLVWVEKRQAAPMLSPELWGARSFILGSITVVLTFMAVMGCFFLLPFYLEQIWHFDPPRAGGFMAVLAFTNALISPVGGYLADRWGNMLILRLGSAIIVGGLISLGGIGPEHSSLLLAGILAVIGLGFGLFQAPNLNEVLRGVRPGLMGLAASTNAVLKNLGALLGVSLTVLIFAAYHVAPPGPGTGGCGELQCFRLAVAAAAGVAVVNLALNLVPRKT